MRNFEEWEQKAFDLKASIAGFHKPSGTNYYLFYAQIIRAVMRYFSRPITVDPIGVI